MDPVAASTEMALRDMGINVREVRTGRAYLIDGDVPREERQQIASRVLANGVIESVHFDAYLPTKFETGRDYQFKLPTCVARFARRCGIAEAQPRGASVSVAGGDESDPGLFPRAEPRADGYRAGNPRANVERALRSQNAEESQWKWRCGMSAGK